MTSRFLALALWPAAALCCASLAAQPAPSAPQAAQHDHVRFFETSVRPLLAEKCQGCHNDQLKTSEFSLTTRESAMLGGTRGPAVIPGQPAESLLVQAVSYNGELKMPPTGKLSDSEIDVLKRWVADDAAWGSDAETAPSAGHWSFRPIEHPEPPDVSDESWVRNPIDRFVLAKLDQERIRPSAEADRRTLIRRLSLDITGLPPSPDEVAAFLTDQTPDAYGKLVDSLLASPHYGERWGRHWLDIARYADSNGYSIDGARSIWKYRDWVIQALNDNMPFDRFVIEQIAGDLLDKPSEAQLIATGFHRNTMVNQEGGIDFEQYRVEAVVDRVSTTGAAFLGLTIGCARCHDHKFDPIKQKEFYRLYAFFNNFDELSGEFSDKEGRKRMLEPILEFGEPDEFAGRDALRLQRTLLENELGEYEKRLDEQQREWESGLTEKQRAEIPPNVIDILDTPLAERNPIQNDVLADHFRSQDAGWKARRDGVRALRRAEPKLESTLIVRELPQPRQAFVHLSGDFTRKGETVEAGTPAALPPLRASGAADRLDLAHWLVSAENPLTPRVTVNRIWQRYFGLGIVETENDFGSQGTPPSHPQLLDWLASDFVRNGWDLKAMHRLIVSSATYRQASAAAPALSETTAEPESSQPRLSEKDPRNRLLARQSRIRLEAEIIRDSSLAASGLLNPAIGGPSVHPPQPAGAGQFTQVDRKWEADTGPNRYRRGMYTFFWRSAPHPGLALFDAPNAQATTTRRNRSNTPLQALMLLNDEAQIEFARALAAMILKHGGDSREERIRYAFERCLARPPRPRERERFSAYLTRTADDFRARPEGIEEVTGRPAHDSDADVLSAAWTAASRVLLNLDEFVTRP